MPTFTFAISEEANDILEDYKTYGFQNRNELIIEAVNRLILQKNFHYLMTNTLQSFSSLFKSEFGDTLSSLEAMLLESNTTLLKNKTVFLNDFLGVNKSSLDWERKLNKYITIAKEEINANRDTVKSILEKE